MSVEGIVLFLAISVIFGAIGEAVSGFSAGNFLVRTGLGFIGATIGRWLPLQFDIPTLQEITLEGTRYPLVWSVAGAALFVAVVGALWGERLQ